MNLYVAVPTYDHAVLCYRCPAIADGNYMMGLRCAYRQLGSTDGAPSLGLSKHSSLEGLGEAVFFSSISAHASISFLTCLISTWKSSHADRTLHSVLFRQRIFAQRSLRMQFHIGFKR